MKMSQQIKQQPGSFVVLALINIALLPRIIYVLYAPNPPIIFDAQAFYAAGIGQ